MAAKGGPRRAPRGRGVDAADHVGSASLVGVRRRRGRSRPATRPRVRRHPAPPPLLLRARTRSRCPRPASSPFIRLSPVKACPTARAKRATGRRHATPQRPVNAGHRTALRAMWRLLRPCPCLAMSGRFTSRASDRISPPPRRPRVRAVWASAGCSPSRRSDSLGYFPRSVVGVRDRDGFDLQLMGPARPTPDSMMPMRSIPLRSREKSGSTAGRKPFLGTRVTSTLPSVISVVYPVGPRRRDRGKRPWSTAKAAGNSPPLSRSGRTLGESGGVNGAAARNRVAAHGPTGASWYAAGGRTDDGVSRPLCTGPVSLRRQCLNCAEFQRRPSHATPTPANRFAPAKIAKAGVLPSIEGSRRHRDRRRRPTAPA